MILTVLMPDGTQAQVDVADSLLIFDGSDFVRPQNLKWAMLYSVPVHALELSYKSMPQMPLITAQRIRALVIGVSNEVVADTDPSLVVVNDPSLGECVCLITCSGTNLQFVTVYTEN